jgi:hypothetical protein
MGNTIKVVASDFDTLKFERAYLEGDQAHGVVSGTICNLNSKPTLLDAGLAFCQPLDPGEAENWPVYSDLETGGVVGRFWNITNDPATVQAARELLLRIAHL